MLTADRKQKLSDYYQKNKELFKERGKEWAKQNPEKKRLSNRKVQVKTTYGLEWRDYVALYNKAEGRCEICHTFLELTPIKDKQNSAACVDHCHTTGVVRGILCRSCNVAIGHLQDSKDRAYSAFKYLEKVS
jgi:hypothetical protein